MKELLKRLKARHWDQDVHTAPGFISVRSPFIRRVALWWKKHWRERPLALLATLAALIGAVAALIQVLR